MQLARALALFRNATMGSALVFALSGLAFALANILIARAMPVEDYARFALAIAAYNVAALIAPLGMDQLSIRRSLAYTPRVAIAQFGLASLVGTLVALAAGAYVSMERGAIVALAAAIATGGLMVGATAELRRRGSTFLALSIYILPNIGLLMIGLAALAADGAMLTPVLWTYALSTALAACGALLAVWRGDGFASGLSGYRLLEALPLVGLAALGTLTLQMERLVLPAMLDLESLATFSLLSSLAIFPFRLISSGMGFALTPQLSDREHIAANYVRVKNEMLALALLLVLAAAVLVLLVPIIMPWLTDGRYSVDMWLVLAACASGIVMLAQALSRAIITALGSIGMLHVLNAAGWAGLVLAVIAAWLGSAHGLIGVMLAVALAQGLVAFPLFSIAWRSFARQAAA